MKESLWELIERTVSSAGTLEKGVLLVLVLMSLVSWCVIVSKWYTLSRIKGNVLRFLAAFDAGDTFGSVVSSTATQNPSPHLNIFRAGVAAMEARSAPAAAGGAAPAGTADARRIAVRPPEAPLQAVVLQMQHASVAEFSALSRGLNYLATIGSTTPFIGLFGTVWGIMDTFRALGNAESASLAVVAPGVSNALIATAAGLAVAIPAVMAYNAFVAQLDDLRESADCFIERVTVAVEASGWPGTVPGAHPGPDAHAPAASHPAHPVHPAHVARPHAFHGGPGAAAPGGGGGA